MAFSLNEVRFLPEKTRQIYAQLPTVFFASIVNAIILSYILWDEVPPRRIVVWLASVLGLTLLRHLSYLAYNRWADKESGSRRWIYIFLAGLLLSGLVWGATGILLFAEHSVPHQIFVAFVVGGMVAGSIASISILRCGFYLFSVPALLPLIVRFLLIHDQIHLGMGIMIIVFLCCCIFISANFHRSAVGLLKLRCRNEQEIARRRQSEKALVEHKNELEKTVSERTADLERINEELRVEILERRKAEEALLESREQFRTMVENIPDVVLRSFASFPWRAVHISEKVLGLTGYRLEEFQQGAISWGDIIHADDLENVRKAVAQGVKEHSPYEIIYRIVHRDGTERWVQERGQAIYDKGGTAIFLDGAISDITEKRMFEEELYKSKNLEALGILAGGLAHDFNNLLMAVFGNIELALHRMDKTGPGYRNLVNAVGALDKCRHLTRQLLTFAKGDSLEKESISLPKLIEDAARFILSGTAIRTVVQVPGDLWMVEINRGQMEQVLHNLLLNCKESIPDGGTVTITATNTTLDTDNATVTAGRYVRISVADDGPGIKHAILDKIFNPYFSTKKRGGGRGTGLGLAICHSIVSKHKGHISAQNGPDGGAVFSLLLPAAGETRSPERAALPAKDTVSEVAGRILVMEDETEVGLVTCKMLEALGFEPELAENGEQAIASYDKNMQQGKPFDLVVMDLTIRGGMGGEETITKLLSLDPAVKAIVASGYADDPILANYRTYGFRGAIAKPYTLGALREMLQQQLS